jgi:osmotically inducible protein OsmC
MIAAAHASCFSMALGAQLGNSNLTPEKIETEAAVTLAKTDGGFAITRIALTTKAKVPGASKEVFDTAAANAKAGCPISKLFANNTEITLNATLE